MGYSLTTDHSQFTTVIPGPSRYSVLHFQLLYCFFLVLFYWLFADRFRIFFRMHFYRFCFLMFADSYCLFYLAYDRL